MKIHPSRFPRVRLTRHPVQAGLATALLLSAGMLPAFGQATFSQDFNGQTVGNTATGFTSVVPGSATANRGAVIINQSTGDNALNLFDTDGSGNARIEQDFTSSSLGYFAVEFQRNADLTVNTSTESTQAFYVTIGYNGAGISTAGNRLLEVRFYNNGQFRINRGTQDGSGAHTGTSLTTAASFESAGTTFSTHLLQIYVRDDAAGDPAVQYTGPDSVVRTLDPNSFDVFINGTRIVPASGASPNGSFGLLQSAAYNTDNNLGRFGLLTGGSSVDSGINFVADNLFLLSAVPEVSPLFALFPLSALLAVWRLRRDR